MAMKKKWIILCLIVAAAAVACNEKPQMPVELDDAFSITQPVPEGGITRVTLSETQKGYVREGNKMAFKLLKQLVGETNGSFVCSPLSLQLALAMTANGAEGETLQEMLNVLGCGHEGMAALNAYSQILLTQLPAIDKEVTIKMADALVAIDLFPLKKDFRETLKTYYYAPAVSMSFDDPQQVLAQINEWARRNTEGLIDPILKEMSPNAVAYLMNSLYFKAKWQGTEWSPMFNSDFTQNGTFYKAGGKKVQLPFMASGNYFPYADQGSFEMVALPYASGKFFLYILLPKTKDGLDALVASLSSSSWNSLISSLKMETEVHLRLPRFEVSGDFQMNRVLEALGMRRAFSDGEAQFGGLFDGENPGFYIYRVVQKAKIQVAEWGTEAAAVTVVEMAAKSAMPAQTVEFTADHPFVFVLGEQESGTILFEGIYSGD